MIEEGFVLYVQAGLAALSPPVSVPPGFPVQLTPNLIGTDSGQVSQAWSYRSIVAAPSYNLQTESGWTEWHVQVDSHGTTMTLAFQLARAIAKVLRGGFQGLFSDPDSTRVFGIYRLPSQVDGYSDANRSYVRSLEFVIQYLPT